MILKRRKIEYRTKIAYQNNFVKEDQSSEELDKPQQVGYRNDLNNKCNEAKKNCDDNRKQR